MKELKRRLITGLLAFAMVFSNMPGMGMLVANAESTEPVITRIEVPETLPSNATETTVTVIGENLPDTLWVKGDSYWNDGASDVKQGGSWAEVEATGSSTQKTVTVTFPSVSKAVKWDVTVKPVEFSSATKATILAASENPEQPSVDNKVLNIAVKDSEGNAVEGLDLSLSNGTGSWYITKSIGRTAADGTLSYDVSEDMDLIDDFDLILSDSSEYTLDSAPVIFFAEGDNGETVIDTVDNNVYTGLIELTVNKNASEEETPAISSVEVTPASVEDGGKVTVKVTGTALPEELFYTIYARGDKYGYGSVTDFFAGSNSSDIKVTANGTASEKTFEVTLPKKSTVSCVDGTFEGFKIGVALAFMGNTVNSSIIQVSEGAESAEPTITRIEVPETLPSNATETTVTVIGENLPDTLWVKGDSYWNDGASDVKQGGSWAEVEATGSSTQKTVTVTFPSVSKAVKWDVTVKPVEFSSATKATILAASENPDQPTVDRSKFVVKAVDAEGNPVQGVKVALKPSWTSTSTMVGTTGPSGEVTVNVNSSWNGDYTVTTLNNSGYQVVGTPSTVYFAEGSTQDEYGYYLNELKTVNGSDYDGSVISMTVETAVVEPNPEIQSVTCDPMTNVEDGSKVTVKVTGTALPEELFYTIYARGDKYGHGSVTDFFAGSYSSDIKVTANGTASEKTFEVTLPKKSTVSCVDGTFEGFKIGVALAFGGNTVKSSIIQVSEGAESVEPVITRIEVPETLPSNATETTVTVIGENLPDTLWVKGDSYWNDGASEVKQGGSWAEVEATGSSTQKTVTVTFPSVSKAVKWDVAVKPVELSSATKATILVASDESEQKKPSITNISFEKTVFDSKGGTVSVTLDGENLDVIDLKDITAKVFLAGNATATDIAVAVNRNDAGKPVLTFNVPANETGKTQNYILKVYYKSSEVIVSTDRENKQVVAVLPAGAGESDQTLGAMTISAVGNSSGSDLKNAVAEVSKQLGSLKVEIRLYGTNLDNKKTKIRAIDENGILWPVYDVPECDGTWRFIAIAGTDKNGIFGQGNSQLIELLPPRYAGTNKKYTIQVSIDGENWITEDTVTLQVNNENIKGETDFRECGAENLQTLTINYVDESGKQIAESDVYKGYGITMVQQFGIAPKTIEGYTLVEEKNPSFPDDMWMSDAEESYSYVYKADKDYDISKAAVSGISNKTYTGKAITQKPSVKANGKTLVNGTDYTVTYSKNINVGTATVKITGKGKYEGTVTKTFKINPKGTSVSKVTGQKKAVKVVWKKQLTKMKSSYVSGYQVQYSTSNKFTSKTSKIKSAKFSKGRTTKTIKKLKAKKRYYVRVRTYKTVNGKRYYSGWSSAKSVRTR